jgi:hypothetical protein
MGKFMRNQLFATSSAQMKQKRLEVKRLIGPFPAVID